MEKKKHTEQTLSTGAGEFEPKEVSKNDEEIQVFHNPNVDFDDEDIIIPKPAVKKNKVGSKKSITITFRENRTFELQIGQETMRFEGRETKTVDKELLQHPAFIQARKYFNIKGI